MHVVDDDAAVLTALARLLGAAGLQVRTFSSAQAFLSQHAREHRGCLVLDLSMPGGSGFDVQEALADEDCPLPVVFLSGHGDVVTSVRAMKSGAVDFLTKPFEAETLIGAVRQALARDCVSARVATLTPRERQVLGHLVEGKLNKQIAADLGASEKTIKVHRARVLQKMAAHSIAGLVRMTERAGLKAAPK